MAFGAASNYNNLPNGVFSPTIFSKKAQMAFRKKSVVEDITNSDYFGEIANFGDTVRIIKEPEIAVNPYLRGTQVTPQDLEDVDFTLTIDQANWWAFKLDDIEKQQSHIGWMELATNRAAYRMSDQYDMNVLAYMSGYNVSAAGVWTVNTTPVGTVADLSAGTDEWLTANKLDRLDFVPGASSSDSIAVGTAGTFDATPLEVLNRMDRILNLNNVDRDGRWVVVDPYFVEKLKDENSKLINHDYVGGEDQLTNGRLVANKVRGFRIYESNNLPRIGTGPGTIDTNGSSAHYGVIVAGIDSAVATAQQIDKTETFRDPNSFADVARGLNLYGRKILRPEGLVRAIYNIAH